MKITGEAVLPDGRIGSVQFEVDDDSPLAEKIRASFIGGVSLGGVWFPDGKGRA